MKELPTYITLQEKREIFKDRYRCIDNWTDLKEFLSIKNNTNVLFRGMCEAKYKNYTSVQRHYITHELEDGKLSISHIIQKEIDSLLSLNNELLKLYYNAMGIEPNWFLMNSFLQHYGGITPMLDFSRNPLVALYFMQKDVTPSLGTEEDINNYCSLYYLKIDDFYTINTMVEDISKKISNGIEDMHQKIESVDKEEYSQAYSSSMSAMKNYCRCAKDLIDKFFTSDFYRSYEDLVPILSGKDAALVLSEKVLMLDYPSIGYHKRIVTTTNLNSIAQNGVFVLISGTNPFEAEFVHCLDINKSVLSSLRAYLTENNITQKVLFPEEEKLASQAKEQL